jgi:hypothetical protein
MLDGLNSSSIGRVYRKIEIESGKAGSEIMKIRKRYAGE